MSEYNEKGFLDPEKAKNAQKENHKKTDGEAQQQEESKSITPTDPDITPHDTTQDAKERWDTESPASKGQPNRIDPEPGNKDISPEEINPDVYPESDIDEDPDAHKNVK